MKELLRAMQEYIIEYISHRLFIVSVIMFILFFMLIGRLFKLQIVEGEEHLNNFTYKSKKTLTVEASRGNIYDCNGKLLAYNQLAYSVTFENSSKLTEIASENEVSENSLKNSIVHRTIQILEKNGDSIRVDFPIILDRSGQMRFNTSSDGERLRFLAEVYGKSSSEDLTDEEQNASAADVFAYMAGKKLFDVSDEYNEADALKIVQVRYALWLNRYQQYLPVTIARDISDNSVAELNENSSDLMGINVVVDSIRVYNDAEYFAHIIGYIGAISTDEMNDYNEELSEKNQYSSNDMIGKTGLEQRYESTLRGTNGIEEIYVDNLGKIIERTNAEDSVAGQDIYLTIDSDLQKYCYNTLEKEIASVLLANIIEEEIEEDEEESKDKRIPASDVYYALFDNNALDITHLSSENAGSYEQVVNNTLNTTREYVLSRIRQIMLAENTAMNNLDDEYTAYMHYIYSLLGDLGIYDTKRIESTDDTYREYRAGNISLGMFLQYAINQGAVDITPFEISSDYYDSQEVYNALVDYVENVLAEDTEFDKLIMKYMIKSKNVSGEQIIYILFEQGVLDQESDNDYTNFVTGKLSDYKFIRRKINNLEITPAQLALDPCEGSVVITDVDNGNILAMVSYPSYDNNRLTNSVEPEYYARLIADKTKPLYNRATQQRTAPGSTYKMLTTIAGVAENAIQLDTMIDAEGIFTKADPPPKCWLYPGKHGKIGIEEALEVSCNYFFYEVGYRLGGGDDNFSDSDGLEKLSKYASLFGLDTNSGIELEEIAPNVSDETVIRSAIGQGTNSYTPTQLSRYVTTIAANGTCYDLSIIKEIKNIDGETTYENPHNIHGTVDIASSLWNTVHNGMRRVVMNHTPEDMLINQINVEVAGKTGTAEENLARPAHALFVSYAPFNKPEISVTTVIPYGYSSGNAEELAGFIYAYYFDPEKLENASITGNVNMAD